MGAAIVFGATGGIGSELSRRLRARGWDLMLAGRSEERLESLRAELDASACPLDATSAADVNACVEKAAKTFGGVAGIVSRNNSPTASASCTIVPPCIQS